MITIIVSSVVALLTQFLPLINSSAQVAKVIETLINILPTISQVAQDLVAPIKNIIAALSANPAADAQQIATLKALDTAYDAAFEAAATAAEAEDAAATPAPTVTPS